MGTVERTILIGIFVSAAGIGMHSIGGGLFWLGICLIVYAAGKAIAKAI